MPNISLKISMLAKEFDTRHQGYKLITCSTQLSMKFILPITVKMPTIDLC